MRGLGGGVEWRGWLEGLSGGPLSGDGGGAGKEHGGVMGVAFPRSRFPIIW